MTDWQHMERAPRDGSPFLVQYLPYGRPVLCMRRVRLERTPVGITVTDLGAWLHVSGIDVDLEDKDSTTADPGWSIAPDHLNSVSAWRWCEIPTAPTETLRAIKAALKPPGMKTP